MPTTAQFGRWTAVVIGATIAGVLPWYYRGNDARLAQRDMAELVEAATERAWALCVGTNDATLVCAPYFDPRTMWVYYGLTNTVIAAPLRDVVYGTADKVRRAAWGNMVESWGASPPTFYTGTLARVSFVELYDIDTVPVTLWLDQPQTFTHVATCDKIDNIASAMLWQRPDVRDYSTTLSIWWTNRVYSANPYFSWEYTNVTTSPHLTTNRFYTNRADPAREVLNGYTNAYMRMITTWQAGRFGNSGAETMSKPVPLSCTPAWAGKRYRAWGIAERSYATFDDATVAAAVTSAWNAAVAAITIAEVTNQPIHAWRNVSVDQDGAQYVCAEVDYCWVEAVPIYPCWQAVQTGMVNRVLFAGEITANVGGNTQLKGPMLRQRATGAMSALPYTIDNNECGWGAGVNFSDHYLDTVDVRAYPTNGMLTELKLTDLDFTDPADMVFTAGITNAPTCPAYPGEFYNAGAGTDRRHRSGFQVYREHTIVYWNFNTFTNLVTW
jgi:hypothetical protein